MAEQATRRSCHESAGKGRAPLPPDDGHRAARATLPRPAGAAEQGQRHRPRQRARAEHRDPRGDAPTVTSATSTAWPPSSSHVGSYRNYAHYTVTLSPWLWLLTRTADCRIFQEKKVPDIIKEVFRRPRLHGLRGLAQRQLPGADVLRPVPRDRLQLRQPPDGAGGHLLLLQARRRRSTRWSSRTRTSPFARCLATRRSPTIRPDEHGRREQEHLTRGDGCSGTSSLGSTRSTTFDFEKPKADLLRQPDRDALQRSLGLRDLRLPGGVRRTGRRATGTRASTHRGVPGPRTRPCRPLETRAAWRPGACSRSTDHPREHAEPGVPGRRLDPRRVGRGLRDGRRSGWRDAAIRSASRPSRASSSSAASS